MCCAAAVYACAPRNRTGDNASLNQPATAARSSDTTGLALTVTESNASGEMSFALEYKNAGKMTELRFANGKTHDFVVLDERDREVWRWSAGRLFTQSLKTKQLKRGDALRYEAKWDSAAPGNYRVIASLNSPGHSEPLEMAFVVK